MEINIKDTYNFADYSHFESLWVNIILCKELLPRVDMLKILNYFNMKFIGDNWENNISTKEMGQVLYGDIEKEKLIIYLNKYIQDCYPKLFSLEEAKKIYNALLNIDTEIDIIKIWLSMTEKNSYSETIENKLCGLEQLKNDKKLNEILSVDDKIIKNNVFSNMIEEIMLCFYKLAMKSYVK